MNNSSLYGIDAIFSNFTGLERENYWRTVSRELIFVNNLIAYQTNASDAISMAYNNTIFCKTLLEESLSFCKISYYFLKCKFIEELFLFFILLF